MLFLLDSRPIQREEGQAWVGRLLDEEDANFPSAKDDEEVKKKRAGSPLDDLPGQIARCFHPTCCVVLAGDVEERWVRCFAPVAHMRPPHSAFPDVPTYKAMNVAAELQTAAVRNVLFIPKSTCNYLMPSKSNSSCPLPRWKQTGGVVFV